MHSYILNNTVPRRVTKESQRYVFSFKFSVYSQSVTVKREVTAGLVNMTLLMHQQITQIAPDDSLGHFYPRDQNTFMTLLCQQIDSNNAYTLHFVFSFPKIIFYRFLTPVSPSSEFTSPPGWMEAFGSVPTPYQPSNGRVIKCTTSTPETLQTLCPSGTTGNLIRFLKCGTVFYNSAV